MRVLVVLIVLVGAVFLQLAQWLGASKASTPLMGKFRPAPRLELPVEAQETAEFLSLTD